ncbi:MAG: hypothetical protein H6690_03290 [Erysipelotrichaceae bacterium]|nr:hypothetical protein [Erysipelotrichaceae bacterium]
MDIVEEYYKKVKTYIKSKDYPTALIWSRRVIEEICKEVLEKNGYKVKPKDNISTYLTEITKNEWLPSVVLLDFRIIQNFGNFANHGKGKEILDIDETLCATPLQSLNKIMVWYRNEFQNAEAIPLNLSKQNYKNFLKKSSLVIFLQSFAHRRLTFFANGNSGFLALFLPFLTSRIMFLVIVIDDNYEYGVIDRRIGEYLRWQIDKKSFRRPFLLTKKTFDKVQRFYKNVLVLYIGITDNLGLNSIRNFEKIEHKYPLLKIDGKQYLMLTGDTPMSTLNLVFEFVEDPEGLKFYLKKLG